MAIELLIDINRNGTFSEDVSSILVQSQSFLGFSGFLDDVSSPTQWTFSLLDEEGKYNTDKPYSEDILGCMAKLSIDGTRMIQAWINSVAPHQEDGGWATVVQCSGRMGYFESQTFPIQEIAKEQTLSTMLKECFQQVFMPFPYPSNFFVLDSSRLDTGESLYGGSGTDSGYIIPDDTIEVPIVLEHPKEPISSRVGQLIGFSLGGRIFERRDGRMQYHLASHDANATVIKTISAGDLTQISALQGGVINNVEVIFTPKEIRNNAVIYRHVGEPIVIKQGVTEYKISYNDPDDEEITGVYRFSVSSHRFNYTVDDPDDDGDTTLSVRFNHLQDDITSSVVSFEKSGDKTCYVDELVLIGEAVFVREQDQITVSSVDSKKLYGNLITTRVGNRYIHDLAAANNHGNEILRFFSRGRLRYGSIEITDPSSSEFALTIGNAIKIKNSVTGHNRNYVIISENLTLAGGERKLVFGLTDKDRHVASTDPVPNKLRYRGQDLRYRSEDLIYAH